MTPLPKGGTGDVLPNASYRMDDPQRYGTVAKGRIENGVLKTEATDAHLPFYGNVVEMEMYIKGLRLELDLNYAGKPVIAIINTWSDINHCHTHFKQRVEEVKRGVWQAGGFPVELPAMSLGEPMMKPTTATTITPMPIRIASVR